MKFCFCTMAGWSNTPQRQRSSAIRRVKKPPHFLKENYSGDVEITHRREQFMWHRQVFLQLSVAVACIVAFPLSPGGPHRVNNLGPATATQKSWLLPQPPTLVQPGTR